MPNSTPPKSPLAGTVCAYAHAAQDNPITAGTLVMALAREVASLPRSALDMRRRRLVLDAVGEFEAGRAMAVYRALAQADALAGVVDLRRHLVTGSDARPANSRATIGYDPHTRLVWGFGLSLPEAMAQAGYALVLAGKADLMAHILWHRADALFGRALEMFGPDIPWHLSMAGVAVPDIGYEVASGCMPGPPASRSVAIQAERPHPT